MVAANQPPLTQGTVPPVHKQVATLYIYYKQVLQNCVTTCIWKTNGELFYGVFFVFRKGGLYRIGFGPIWRREAQFRFGLFDILLTFDVFCEDG